MLGTAQLGLDYGIANVLGKPTEAEVSRILECAWSYGIRIFDTAPRYCSEALLGRFFKEHGLEDKALILTKVPPLKDHRQYRSKIESTISKSLELLHCGRIEVLFFHDPKDSRLLKTDPVYFEGLQKKYNIRCYGVSVYEPNELEYSYGSRMPVAVQFPHNVCDRRFNNVKMRHGTRYGRSIFLQGLLIDKNSLRRETSRRLANFRSEYLKILANSDLDPISFAISFVTSSSISDFFVIGIDSSDQLRRIAESHVIPYPDVDPLADWLSGVDCSLIDPRTWS